MSFYIEMFRRWLREKLLSFLEVDRGFECQREYEMETKCFNQCEHCSEYYKPLEDTNN